MDFQLRKHQKFYTKIIKKELMDINYFYETIKAGLNKKTTHYFMEIMN